MTYSIKTSRGFTIVEMMFAVMVLAVLVSLAVPSFIEIINSNRVTAQNNNFVTALNYARSEALRQVRSVAVCASSDNATCSAATDWSTGWIAFTDLNSDGALNGSDTMLQAWPATGNGMALNSTTRSFVRYGSNGVASGTETFTLKKSGCSGVKAREITISTTGRVNTRKVAC
jgi:type IV fimbrial biogenesis protein FimT